jgi:pyruvate/2-oxoglutarate dehydrogenase complex dihydrolipoamide acyltransferase (E2) component
MDYKLRDILDSDAEAQIVSFFKKENEAITEGEELIELTTDKAAFVVEAPQSGTLKKIYPPAGTTLQPEDLLFQII